MIDSVEGFGEVEEDHQNVESLIHAVTNLVHGFQKVSDNGFLQDESVLFGGDDIIAVEMVHHDVSNHTFHQLTRNRSQRDWSVVAGDTPTTFLEDGADLGEFSGLRNLTT